MSGKSRFPFMVHSSRATCPRPGALVFLDARSCCCRCARSWPINEVTNHSYGPGRSHSTTSCIPVSMLVCKLSVCKVSLGQRLMLAISSKITAIAMMPYQQ